MRISDWSSDVCSSDLDWFAASEIRWLAAIAAVGFVAFLIWELTDKNPIVDLRIFRHRGFVAASVTYTVAFGAFLDRKSVVLGKSVSVRVDLGDRRII